jgi:dienelactone hydrolase
MLWQSALALIAPLVLAVPGIDELRKLHDYDASRPLEIQEASVTDRGGVNLHDLSYASPRGGRVTAYLVVPEGKGPFAGLIFMHGGNGNRGSLLPGALLFAKTGAVCLLMDSPLNGARAVPGQPLADFTQPQRTRQAMIQTVVDLRRGVDLLSQRADVDRKRLGYIGASYGGSIGGVLAGVEPRIKAYALLVGIGSLGDFLRDSPHPTAAKARQALTPDQVRESIEILDDVQPIHYISHAAPSALFFQNGRTDAFMPIESVNRYHAAGSEPKQIKWYDAGHGLNAEAFADRAKWLAEQIGIGPLPPEAAKKLGKEDTR